MLRIYEKDLTSATVASALMTNGLGPLPFALSCVRHQKINGDWSLTLTYPLDAAGAELLQPERILCYEDDRSAQCYRISRRKPKTTRQGRVIEVEAPHLCYDLAHKRIENIETKEDNRFPDGITAAQALEQLLAGTGFTPGDVTAAGDTLDYLDILRKDVMTCLKHELLEKWGGELEFDNFTVHLRQGLGRDRRYPIRDGRNIQEITITENYEPVVTRLHVAGYEEANFEDINNGKDYLDSELTSRYSFIREGDATFEDVDDPEELLRLGREELARREVPEITYGIRLAEMRGTVQYAAYRRLESFQLGDTAVLHTQALDRDVILRCEELETDCLTGRNTSVKLGNTDAELIGNLTAGANANDRLSRVLDAQGNVRAEQIAGKLNLVRVENLKAAIAEIAEAVLGDATIDAAQINDLAAEVARIIVADIGSMEVDWAGITALTAATAEIVKAQIDTADIDWAHIKDLAAGTAIITKGEAGELYIARLAVTEANMVSLTLGELLLKGADGGFYAISVDENGEIVTTRKQVANDDVGDASINGGEKLIEGSVTAAVLNAQDIFADSAIIRKLIAANLDVDTLFAREATIKQLNAMDITGNEYLKALVEDGDRKNSGSLTVLADQLASQVKRVQEMQDALTGKADGAALTELATRITQTAEAIRAEVVRGDNLAAGLDEANKALASYRMSFQLDADGVTIAASNSKIDLHLANDRLEFRQNGQVVAYVSNERLYIGSAEVTDSLVVGRYEFKRMRDGSLGVLYRVPDESAPTDTSAKLGEAKLGKLALGK